ncbi:MAG: HK97 gp10 family phage protein [Candidatus Bathyarchaeota archaeon]|nr:HK97 gp10 family phage protein [Candidatus Bathyarchaeota archaeon]
MSIEFTLEINDQDFRDRIQKVDQAIQDAVQDALVQAANAMVLRARQLVPVRTGYLQSTIYAKAQQWQIELCASASYAAFQELGTSRIQPHLFLTRSLQEVLPQLPAFISEAIQRSVEEVA